MRRVMDGWLVAVDEFSGFQTGFRRVSNYCLLAPHTFCFTDVFTPTVVDTQFIDDLQASTLIQCFTPTYSYNICLYSYISLKNMYTYTHIYICIFSIPHNRCIHTYVHTYIHTNIHTYIRTSMHSYIHTHIHTYMHGCIHTYIYTCIHT